MLSDTGSEATPTQSPERGAAWRHWHDLGRRLTTAEGVHRPSEFSALLASSLVESAGLSVLDAGCGSGLISVAALAAGAGQVIAMDRDPAALEITATNVEASLGTEARGRLSLWQADFSQLGVLDVDLLAINPPQRPGSILARVEPDQRHLHTGGGNDGLQTLRLVLAATGAKEVRTTAAPSLAIAAAGPFPGWATPRRIAAAELPLHPAWQAPEDKGEVGVWVFRRP